MLLPLLNPIHHEEITIEVEKENSSYSESEIVENEPVQEASDVFMLSEMNSGLLQLAPGKGKPIKHTG